MNFIKKGMFSVLKRNIKSWGSICSLMLLFSCSVSAQDKFYTSPVVNKDNSVTFSVYAPQANDVSVEMLNSGITSIGSTKMVKDKDGLWQVTLGPFTPEIYYYLFNTDGSKHTDNKNQNVKKWLNSVSVFEISGEQPLIHELQAVAHGTIHQHYYDSKATSTQRLVNIYTPPHYSIDKKYPVLFLLHGWGGANDGWLEYGKIQNIADNLLAANKMEPMIIVMPDSHPLGREFEKSPVNWESYTKYLKQNNPLLDQDIKESLLPFIKQHYAVTTESNKLAIAGLSMGGQQAIEIGFSQPNTFGSIISLSGSYYGEQQYQHLEAFNSKVKATNNQTKLFWLMYGKDELTHNESPKKLHKWLSSKGVTFQWTEEEGGHEWDTWRRNAVRFLPLLFK